MPEQPFGLESHRPAPFVPGEILVSVVIPARDEEAYIERALDSVLGQRLPIEQLECIVVDNGSTDHTAWVVRRFIRAHPPLRTVLVAEAVPGTSRAKNRGAEAAHGRIILFLDADSYLDPETVPDVLRHYAQGSPAGTIRVVADSGDWLERGFFDLMELGQVLFGIRTEMMYCDRELFLKMGGFRPELHLAEDLDLAKRLQAYLRRDGGEPVCHIRTSAISTSPRRLRERPFHLGLVTVFARWALAFVGIGRTRHY